MENTLLEKQKFAYNKITSLESEISKKKYKTSIENFGLLVYTNGLISAMAVTKKKNSDLYNHIKDWLKPKYYLLGFENDELLKNLLDLEMDTLLIITDEVIQLADVLKQFAKAEL